MDYNFSSEEEDFLDGDHTAVLKEHIFGHIVILEEALKRGLI